MFDSIKIKLLFEIYNQFFFKVKYRFDIEVIESNNFTNHYKKFRT